MYSSNGLDRVWPGRDAMEAGFFLSVLFLFLPDFIFLSNSKLLLISLLLSILDIGYCIYIIGHPIHGFEI